MRRYRDARYFVSALPCPERQGLNSTVRYAIFLKEESVGQ